MHVIFNRSRRLELHNQLGLTMVYGGRWTEVECVYPSACPMPTYVYFLVSEDIDQLTAQLINSSIVWVIQVNRLLPSAHFHGQCSKLYIRTYCKARSIHSIFCFICKSVLQLTNWMRTDVTCMYCSYILISSRSRKILMVCFSNCFLLLNVFFVFCFIAICHILLIDLNLYC
ncbi:Os03g0454300 [Oryza sativa Japonica Group]|nr:Os03g0454300 [Oryza sativa Japonica Group]|eukprot:NP_001050477.1 Os03g0454300 [Oryza sativa Japonica Group]